MVHLRSSSQNISAHFLYGLFLAVHLPCLFNRAAQGDLTGLPVSSRRGASPHPMYSFSRHTTTVRTRRFNRISAETRTGQGCCSIRPVRVFCWRLPFAHLYVRHISNTLFGNMQPHKPASPVHLISSGFSFWFRVSSIASRYTSENDGAAIHPNFSLCFAYSLCRSRLGGFEWGCFCISKARPYSQSSQTSGQ